MKRWYLVRTKSRQEELARQNLINQSFETYLPRIEINGKFIPLFSKYIFLKLDDKNQDRSPVHSTKGVSNFIRFGLKFATIPDNIVKTIKA